MPLHRRSQPERQTNVPHWPRTECDSASSLANAHYMRWHRGNSDQQQGGDSEASGIMVGNVASKGAAGCRHLGMSVLARMGSGGERASGRLRRTPKSYYSIASGSLEPAIRVGTTPLPEQVRRCHMMIRSFQGSKVPRLLLANQQRRPITV